MTRRPLPLLAALLLGLAATAAWAELTGAPAPHDLGRIHVVDFEGGIEPVLAAYLERQIDRAEREEADALVLRIDSPGGLVSSAFDIGDALLGVPESIHVVAWVPEMAYSAAAMAALACDEIVLGRDAHIGDAQPVTAGPDGAPKPVGEKLESPLRAKFRDYAARNGYPVPLAEAMVSADIEVLRVRDRDGGMHFLKGEDFRNAEDEAELVPGWSKADLVQVGGPVVREGELLTMTAEEALDLGFLRRTFADGSPFPADEQDLLESLSGEDATIVRIEPTFSEDASRFLFQLSGILAAIVGLAVLVFMWQGPGLMSLIGGIALALLLLVNLTADQLHGFPLFLIGLGVLLLAAEVFLVPGFGIPGVLGFLALGAGFLLLAGGATFERPGVDGQLLLDFGFQFIATVLGGMVLLLVLSRFVPAFGPGRRMVLAAPAAGTARAAADAEAPPATAGERGVAHSALRPAGTARLGDRLVDVVTEGVFVARGESVVVVDVEGSRVTVRPAPDDVPADPADPADPEARA